MSEFYCSEHKHTPPANSVFAFCPQCELKTTRALFNDCDHKTARVVTTQQGVYVLRCPKCNVVATEAEFNNFWRSNPPKSNPLCLGCHADTVLDRYGYCADCNDEMDG